LEERKNEQKKQKKEIERLKEKERNNQTKKNTTQINKENNNKLVMRGNEGRTSNKPSHVEWHMSTPSKVKTQALNVGTYLPERMALYPSLRSPCYFP
jgi:hypothetical protein